MGPPRSDWGVGRSGSALRAGSSCGLTSAAVLVGVVGLVDLMAIVALLGSRSRGRRSDRRRSMLAACIGRVTLAGRSGVGFDVRGRRVDARGRLAGLVDLDVAPDER